jgi:hypothetical protein
MEELIYERFRNTFEVVEHALFNKQEGSIESVESELENLRSWVIGFVQGVEVNNVRR